MAPMPPPCPQCPPPAPMLWKDTTYTRPGAADRWRWYCAKCTRHWEPAPSHRLEFTQPAGGRRGPTAPPVTSG